MKQNRLSKLNLFILITVLFFLLFLLSTKIFLPQPSLSYTSYHDLGFPMTMPNLNSDISIIPVPVKVRNETINPYVVPVKTNSEGQRNLSEFSFEKQNDKLRILSLGGSIAFGWPFAVEFSYPAILQTLIPNSEVINASVIGTSPAHILEYYEKLGQRYKPKIVLVQLRPSALIIDDLIQDSLGIDSLEIEWLRDNGYHQWIEENKIKDVAGNITIPIEKLNVTKLIQERVRGGSTLHQFLYSHSHFVRLLKSRGYWFSESTFFKNYLAHQTQLHELTPENSKEFAARNFAPTEAYQTELKKLTDKNNSRLILLVTPNKFGCEAEVLEPWKKLLVNLGKKKIETISFVWDFCDLDKFIPRPEAFLADESHPTMAMYRLIAEKIAAKIQ